MPAHDTIGLIPFDAGLIMSTETEFIFLQHLKLHPGALSVWKNWTQDPIPCGHSRCEMMSFQEQMRYLFDKDTNLCAEFFNRCLEFQGDTPTDDQLARILRELNVEPHPEVIEESFGEMMRRKLEAMLPGSKVRIIKFPPQE